MKQEIVHLARWYHPHIGGVETHVQAVNEALVNRGFSVTVICEQHDAALPLKNQHQGVTIIRIPQRLSGVKLATWLWFWRHRALLQQADRIHAHDVFWWILPWWPLIHKKIYTTFHGWETVYPVRWQAKLQRWFYARLSQKTIHVGDWIKEFYWDEPTAVTYGGVEKNIKKGAPTVIEKNTMLKFVFLGRLSPENEVEAYIKLIQKLQQHFSIQMTWVGDGPLRAECEKVGRVTGFISDPGEKINSAHIVFANSYLSMLSAQAAGKVVCAFYSHSLKKRYLETYPGFAFVIVASKVDEILARLTSLLKQPHELHQLEDSAQKFAQAQTWQSVTETYLELWGYNRT